MLLAELVAAGASKRIFESKAHELAVALGHGNFGALAEHLNEIVTVCDCLDEVLVDLRNRISHSI